MLLGFILGFFAAFALQLVLINSAHLPNLSSNGIWKFLSSLFKRKEK